MSKIKPSNRQTVKPSNRPAQFSNRAIEQFNKRKKAFTLVEVMVALSIFMVVIGLLMTAIVGGFRTFGQGQKMAQREQRKRFVFFRLGKEISSITSITYPGNYFKGEVNSFFVASTTSFIVWPLFIFL